MDEQRLQDIEKRVNAATKGPWHIWSGGSYVSIGHARPSEVLEKRLGSIHPYRDQQAGRDLGPGNHVYQWHHDYAFIAEARQDVPDLLAEVRRLQALVSAQPAEK